MYFTLWIRCRAPVSIAILCFIMTPGPQWFTTVSVYCYVTSVSSVVSRAEGRALLHSHSRQPALPLVTQPSVPCDSKVTKEKEDHVRKHFMIHTWKGQTSHGPEARHMAPPNGEDERCSDIDSGRGGAQGAWAHCGLWSWVVSCAWSSRSDCGSDTEPHEAGFPPPYPGCSRPNAQTRRKTAFHMVSPSHRAEWWEGTTFSHGKMVGLESQPLGSRWLFGHRLTFPGQSWAWGEKTVGPTSWECSARLLPAEPGLLTFSVTLFQWLPGFLGARVWPRICSVTKCQFDTGTHRSTCSLSCPAFLFEKQWPPFPSIP